MDIQVKVAQWHISSHLLQRFGVAGDNDAGSLSESNDGMFA